MGQTHSREVSSVRFPILGTEARKDGDREAMSKKGMRLSRIRITVIPNRWRVSTISDTRLDHSDISEARLGQMGMLNFLGEDPFLIYEYFFHLKDPLILY